MMQKRGQSSRYMIFQILGADDIEYSYGRWVIRLCLLSLGLSW